MPRFFKVRIPDRQEEIRTAQNMGYEGWSHYAKLRIYFFGRALIGEIRD
jgi:hypothetical protein